MYSNKSVRLPIEITEFGWTTSGNSGYVVPEQTRASYIAAFADTVARGDCGVGRWRGCCVAWHTNVSSKSNGFGHHTANALGRTRSTGSLD